MSQFYIDKVKDLKDAVQEIKAFARLSHDTETKGPDEEKDISGLWPFHGARSFAHIIATEKDEYYFDFNEEKIEHRDKILLQPIFDNPETLIFYCNAVFDASISHFDGLRIKSRIADIPSLARVEFNRHGRTEYSDESFLSLSYLAEYYGEQPKIDAVKEYIKEYNLYSEERCRFTNELIPLYDKVPVKLMFPYGCGDGRSTYDTGETILKCINYKDKEYQSERGDRPPMIEVAKNEVKLTSVLVDMKIGGANTWPSFIKRARRTEKKNLNLLQTEIKSLVGGDLNINSGKQLAEYLLERGVELPTKDPTETDIKRAATWKQKGEALTSRGLHDKAYLCHKKARDYLKGRSITDKKTLKKVLERHPELDFLAKITAAKESEKKISTYYDNFLKLADTSHILHCNFNQEKAVTGRFSSSQPNLQNIEKKFVTPNSDDLSVRSSIIADAGHVLMMPDFDQQEMIVMLDQAGAMPVIKKLLNGEFEDFYLATMAILKDMTGRIITRQQAKAIALGLAYGQGKTLLAKNLDMSIEDADAFKTDFFSAIPELKVLDNRLKSNVRRYGKIFTAAGRVLYINKEKEYTALNGFVQGTSADITKISMVNIHEEIKIKKIPARMIMTVHDELIFSVREDAQADMAKAILKIMPAAYNHRYIPLTVGIDYAAINKHGVAPWGEKTKWTG